MRRSLEESAVCVSHAGTGSATKFLPSEGESRVHAVKGELHIRVRLVEDVIVLEA